MDDYLDSYEDEILGLVKSHCQNSLEDTIKSIRWEIVGNILTWPVRDTHEYDNMSAEEFLMIYKINRLESLGIISEEKAIHLRELLEKKEMLLDEFNKITTTLDVICERDIKETIEFFNERLRRIGAEIDEINEELMKYHLFAITNQLLDFKGIIDNVISNEVYPEKEKSK